MAEPVILASGQGEETGMGPHVVRVLAGDFVLAPAGVYHTFAAHGNEVARFLGYFGTGGGIEYLRQLAAAFPADGPPDAAVVAEVHRRYGVEVG